MRFGEILYERTDLDDAKKQMERITESFVSAASCREAAGLFRDMDRLKRHVESVATVAHIRHSIDTRDTFYDQEMKFWNNAGPEIMEYIQRWNKALCASPFRKELEEEFGEIVFRNIELEMKSFDPKIIPLLQEENELTTDDAKLLASARIPFRGETYTLAQLDLYKKDRDDGTRLEAWKTEGRWYRENQEKLDQFYDRLVTLRHRMSRELGLEDYVELGYYRMRRNCYDRRDVDHFREAVRRYLVPVAEGIRRRQAERLNMKYPLSFADCALMFRSGNAAPVGDAREILETARRFYEALSPETGEFFNMMMDCELMDVLSREGKEGGGYCTSIYDYDVPFIFANFNGTRDDVETMTHEAGHAFADWTNRDRVPMETIWPSMEGCEVHSMSMEFFAWKSAGDFFGKDERKFLYSHLAGALLFIPYGTMVDHFQHIMFEHPELTPAQRHAEWKKLLGIYMPWLRLDGEIPFYAEGMGWQRQHHIYSYPFYYIDYCLAQTVALEIWVMMQDDYRKAWDHYMRYIRQGGSRVFTELLARAGLDSPFEEETLKRVCHKAEQWLEAFDLTGIDE